MVKIRANLHYTNRYNMHGPNIVTWNNFCDVCNLQVMLLGSSLQLPPPVLEIPSLLLALLLETSMGSPSGEWVGTPPGVRVGTGNVLCFTEQVHLQFVGLAMSSQLILGLGLEKVLLLSNQH